MPSSAQSFIIIYVVGHIMKYRYDISQNRYWSEKQLRSVMIVNGTPLPK